MDDELLWTTDNENIETNVINGDNAIVTPELKMTAYRMKNFKAFHDSGWIDFAPIVLLYGDNSAGKTTIRQPLLLLKSAYLNERRQVSMSSLSELDDDNISEIDFFNKKYLGDKLELIFKLNDNESEYLYSIVVSKEGEIYKYQHVLYIEDKENYLDEYYDATNVFFLLKKKDTNISERINSVTLGVMAGLKNFCEKFSFMQATRRIPDRVFVFNKKGYSDIQVDGSNTYDNLFSSIKNGVIDNDFVQKWVKEFGFKIEWKTLGQNEGNIFLRDIATGISTNIVDNGFGISQSLPFITKLSYMKNQVLFVDSPEAFLQVNKQSIIADFIIEASNCNNVIISETSSEYILYRLRRRISEKKVDKSVVKIYYIDSSSMGDAKCYEIEIDDTGELDRKSKGFNSFFSSSFDDLGAIMSQGIKDDENSN